MQRMQRRAWPPGNAGTKAGLVVWLVLGGHSWLVLMVLDGVLDGEPNLFLKGKELKSGGMIFRVAGGALKMVLTTNQWLLVVVMLGQGD